MWVICVHFQLTQFGPSLPFQAKFSLVSCALAKHVYLFLAHALLCLSSCHSLCLEYPLPFSSFPPSILSNSHLSSSMSQIKQHPFHKAFSDFHSQQRYCFSHSCSFVILEVICVHLLSPAPTLQKRLSPLRAENIYFL